MTTFAHKIAWFAVASALVAGIALTVRPTTPALAATKTVTLYVPGMTCASCPITLNTALTRVAGVATVDASLEKKEAVVTFDDSKTEVEVLMEATKNAGYPSTVKR